MSETGAAAGNAAVAKKTGVGKQKATFNFAPDTYKALLSLASALQVTQGEILRRAIALLVLYYRAQANGDDLMLRKHGTRELEVIQVI